MLDHAIAPDTPLASAVRLRMHGDIKLGRWLPFRAEQVIRRDGNMRWTATMSPLGIPLFHGFDRLVDGAGEMQWKLFGLLPDASDFSKASRRAFTTAVAMAKANRGSLIILHVNVLIVLIASPSPREDCRRAPWVETLGRDAS